MTQEAPPPYNKENPQQWSEQLVDYLLRRFAQVERDLADIRDRLEVLEP